MGPSYLRRWVYGLWLLLRLRLVGLRWSRLLVLRLLRLLVLGCLVLRWVRLSVLRLLGWVLRRCLLGVLVLGLLRRLPIHLRLLRRRCCLLLGAAVGAGHLEQRVLLG